LNCVSRRWNCITVRSNQSAAFVPSSLALILFVLYSSAPAGQSRTHPCSSARPSCDDLTDITPRADGAAADPAQPPRPSAQLSHARIRIRIVDSIGVPADVRATIAQEVDAIWATAGVAVDRSAAERQPSVAVTTVYVLLRHDTPITHIGRDQRRPPRPGSAHATGMSAGSEGQASSSTEGRIGLAWIPFAEGHAGSVIFVSVDHTRQLLGTLTYEGRSADRCPAALARLLLGRALGRVAAHEIGHYLNGPMHSPSGLMKARLTDEDLLGLAPPRATALGLETSAEARSSVLPYVYSR
jgi:hypothetical protein